jgi:hypothetical protein
MSLESYPIESLLLKLLHAGWITGTGTVEREGVCLRGVLWTDEGLQRSVGVAMMLQELGELSDAEWRCFRSLIRGHAGPEQDSGV